MCGIFALLNIKNPDISFIKRQFDKGKSRGPENSNFTYIKEIKSFIGFHRLAINGISDEKANQPFNIDNIYLICNGEIYNHKSLFKILDIIPYSKSDCEVIIHLYKLYGIKHTVQLLDGVFSFILIDLNKKSIFVARDTYGVRPLFLNTFYEDNKNTSFCFSSVLKSVDKFGNSIKIEQYKPGHFSEYSITNENIYFEDIYNFSAPTSFFTFKEIDINTILKNVFKSLERAVLKRIDNTERDISCLLSGGLDSSVIAALVARNTDKKITTWSIGLEGSEDLKYAKIVADYIGSNHNTIICTEQEFLDAIPNVIYAIESYDTTTVRASVGNWLICKKIKEESNSKVIFNGDGSDEVTGGYMYFHLAPDCLEFDKECRRLLSDIHYFDVLRSDRSISDHGLEARTPFLDRDFVQTYLSINPTLRFHKGRCEKYLLRKAIEKFGNDLLPQEILWRKKEAFSDGVSKQSKSWFEIIQDSIKNKGLGINSYFYNRPKTKEQLYYRTIFSNLFTNSKSKSVIPYFWMPKYCDATDASARTLDIYKNIENIK